MGREPGGRKHKCLNGDQVLVLLLTVSKVLLLWELLLGHSILNLNWSFHLKDSDLYTELTLQHQIKLDGGQVRLLLGKGSIKATVFLEKQWH
jgi:hypothetical protein